MESNHIFNWLSENTGEGRTENNLVFSPTPNKKPTFTELLDTFKDWYTKGTGDELCITFNPRHTRHLTENQIAKATRGLLAELGNIKYILFPELGSSYNFHYHGIIIGARTTLTKVKRILSHIAGRTYLRVIRDTEKYGRYCMKDIDKAETNFGSLEDYKRLIIFRY